MTRGVGRFGLRRYGFACEANRARVSLFPCLRRGYLGPAERRAGEGAGTSDHPPMSRAVSTPNSNRLAASGARALTSLVVAFCAVSSGIAGCDGEPTPADGQDAEAAASQNGATTVTPAVYQTTLAFLGFGAPPTRLFLHLENRTSAETLQLSYGGWLDNGFGWRTVLDVHESTSVPRAAWRILPVGPLRVSVTEGEELAGVAIDAVEGRPRLRIGARLAEWASATGQRESLRRAAVEMEGAAQSGILLASQTARVAGAASRGGEHAILLADTLGNALVILRSGTVADEQVVVHTLFGERSRRWDGAEIGDGASSSDSADAGTATTPDSAADGGVSRLTLTIPGAEIEARIVVEAAADTEARVDLPDASGIISVAGGEPFSMSGFQVALSGDRAEGVEP